MASCVTRKQITYLQDMPHDSVVALTNSYEARIHPNDELTIFITSSDKEFSDRFNLFGSYNNPNVNINSENTLGYLVDINGNITIPVLGELCVDGMTRLQLQDTITSLLEKGNYLHDPVVLVRFKNYKVFFKSATGGQTITISNERVTLLEALAQAGSISAYTKLDKIGVLREENGSMHIRYLNLKSKDVFNDPYFLLQQNDVVLLEPLRASRIRENASWLSGYLSLTASLISVVTILIAL